MNKYFILKKNHPNFDSFIVACGNIQKKYFPKNVLSIVYSDDNLSALVKIGGCTDKDFKDLFFPGAKAEDVPEILSDNDKAVFSMKSKNDNKHIKEELKKSGWSNTRKEVLDGV